MSEEYWFKLTFPSPLESVFSKVISLDWYDGTTSGVAMGWKCASAFRLDILAWGPCQEKRVFAISPLPVEDFERIAALLSFNGAPEWPVWYPGFPLEDQEKRMLAAETDELLEHARSPEYVFASDSNFREIVAIKRLTGPALDLLPPRFSGVPFLDNFDYWKEYLAL